MNANSIPPIPAAARHSGICMIFGTATDAPMMAARNAPKYICPSIPTFQIPDLNAITAAIPVMILGVAQRMVVPMALTLPTEPVISA